VPITPDSPVADIAALQAALAAERLARQEAEARATGAEAMVAHLKLLIAKLKHDKFGASSERGRKLIDQLAATLGELVAAAGKDKSPGGTGTTSRRQPARTSLPEHLPRERVVIAAPSCLVPRFDGAILSNEWKEALWARFVTAAPRPRTPSEQQYSDRRLRSRS
jgi:transposase